MTDDLRTRAREAALKWEPACQGEPSTPSDYVSIGRRVGFEFGYLAHATRQPDVVCICGSTRFRAEMTEANRRLTMGGSIVLAPGVFGHDGDPLTDQDKERLDALHFRKIDMSERVVVVAPGEYIGSSTSREIDYAKASGKPVEVWTKFPSHADRQPGREFGIMRPAPAPDMSGRPRFVQIVRATFPTFEQAVDACHRVPALMGKPAIICVRTAPGEWTEADR